MKGADLTADDELAVLKRGAKMRAESIEQFRGAGATGAKDMGAVRIWAP